MRTFFTTPPASPIENHLEWKFIRPILGKLRAKEKELKRAAEKEGVLSLAYNKSLLVSRLLQTIDEQITIYNHRLPNSNKQQEKQEFLCFIKKLEEIVSEMQNRYLFIFKQQRNNDKAHVSNMIDYGSTFVTLFSLSLPSWWLTGALFLSTPVMNAKLKSLADLDNPVPATLLILQELGQTLHHISNTNEFLEGRQPIPSAPM
ncbi:hypothetical protein [Legionella fairfieldensis]|uniref:hypothetical protein n=1 Tax=Legionella fairfieldensis TaxID=45064 RepID=UPI00048DB798|nr:hypothetical protein [Legionella fairfieldensis]